MIQRTIASEYVYFSVTAVFRYSYHALTLVEETSPVVKQLQFWWYRTFCWLEEDVRRGKLPSDLNLPKSLKSVLGDRNIRLEAKP